MITNFISIKSVMDKLYRDLNLNDELNESVCIEWIAEGLSFIGAFGQYETKSTTMEISDHRSILPCGFYRLSEPPTYNNNVMHYAGNSMFGSFWCEDCRIPTCCTEYNFYIQNGYFHTSLEEGTVCLSYIGIPVDEDGYPKIPDDPYYMKACTMYVTKMLDWQKWRKGQVPDKVMQDSQAQWDFYVQAARGSANMPSIEQLESLKNRMLQLIPKTNEYNRMFKGGSQKKYIQ